ncbi:hypothetical protein EGW08_015564 [Elysia chlorotica]|uniref:Sulfotransferase domain-containing protein n=1 Tax=Elysia chlorotica TaxID=188477 RepID=A0A3S0ZW35_ELYCH|nr:hypothetical protein EGW08_015564 [Elysia chlorotica]
MVENFATNSGAEKNVNMRQTRKTELSDKNVNIRQTTKTELLERARRLPKALIIGFNKCGTAALRSFLSIHPDIVSPNREPRYFSNNYNQGLAWYKSQMPLSTSRQITIEKSPNYIKEIKYLRRIYDMDPQVKLLVIVRNPVTRLQSEYSHEKSKYPEMVSMSYSEWIYINHIERFVVYMSDYASEIRQAYSVFPEEQFLIVSEEDLERDPVSVIRQAETFLNLQPAVSNDVFVFNEKKGFYCFNTSHPFFLSVMDNWEVNTLTGCLVESKGREHPSYDPQLLQQVVNISLPCVQDLFRLIHKKFDWKYYNSYID